MAEAFYVYMLATRKDGPLYTRIAGRGVRDEQ
jgi:hypothetical protein